MGGLAIVLSRRGRAECEPVARMLSTVPHRGRQQTIEAMGQAVFGVVNDPEWITATLARDERYLVVFCGTLDNDADLRERLRREDVRIASEDSPSVTLLAGYGHWGEEVVSRLRGSFAAGITDGRTIWCFRDQFGARPLYHHDSTAGFFAGNEVKQVLSGASLPLEPNLEHLDRVVFGGVNRSTAYHGVERIPKNTVVAVGSAPGMSSRPYWDPDRNVATARMSADDAREGTIEALGRAVRRQLTGRDVLQLSGGLDSPSLGVFAARAEGLAQPVQALTAVYPAYPSVDESKWTRMAADHLGLPLHCYVAEAGSLDDIERWVKLLDGPIDVIAVAECAEGYREARALGARTVLNGEIAEFLFNLRGYLLDHLLAHGRFRAAAHVLGWSRARGRARGKIARDVARAVAPNWIYEARRKRRPAARPPWVPDWIDQRRLSISTMPPRKREKARNRWAQIQASPLRGQGPGFEADEIIAAACGVDSRRPFTDVDLWEFVLSLPAEVKFPTSSTKPLLRESMRGLLPDALLDRKDKTLFNEFHVAKADYPKLISFLTNPANPLKGVDYAMLGERLRAGGMTARELQWARDVARVHVFLNQWS
jgi:asparagine synthase (glutamine-hydrolysing)